MARALVILLFAAASLAAQPYINYRGVVNAASYAPQGLPGGGIARGSIFSIFGRNLGPAQFAVASSFPLGDDLGGVSVQIIQGTTTSTAFPIFVSASQISAIMPSTAPLGKVAVRVRFSSRASNPAFINVVDSAPGIFAINSGGFGPGIVQNFVSATEQPINTTRVTARPGQTLILWGTGLGAVTHADNVAPTARDLPAQVDIFVGGKAATRRYAGRSSCCAGLDQIVFDVPADAPVGCYVPIQVRTNRAAVSNAATIAIESAGSPCSDAFNPVGEAQRKGGRIGIVAPQRFDIRIDLLSAVEQLVSDQIDVGLLQDDGGELFFNPATSLPPVGSCTFYGGRTATSVTDVLGLLSPRSRFLDGGASLQLSGAGSPLAVARNELDSRIYSAILGQQPSLPGGPPLFFSLPGAFNFAIPGGADVLNAQARFETIEPIRWTNRDQLAVLDRAQGLTLTWTGGDPAADVVLIAVRSSDDAANATGLGLCVAPAGSGSFAVPTEILASLPATAANAVRIPAWVFVASARVRSPVQFSAPGLDSAFIVPTVAGVKSVTVR